MDGFKLQQQYRQLTGLSDTEVQTRRPLLTLAADMVERRIKPSIDPKEAESTLILLAAATARYFDMLSQSTGASSIKVADLSVTESKGSGVAEAKTFRDEVLAIAAPLLTDEAFTFYHT